MKHLRARSSQLAVLGLIAAGSACGDPGEAPNDGSGGVVAYGGTGGSPVASGGTGGATLPAAGSGGSSSATGGSSGTATGGAPSSGGSGGASTGGIGMTGGTSSGGRGPGTGGTGMGGRGWPGSGGRVETGGTSGSGGVGSGGIPTGTGGEQNQTALRDLNIEPNPKNVLSCFVSWRTDQPASSAVQFGAGTLEWEISDPALVTEHRVLVIGMRASQAYEIKAISGSASAQGTFTTGQLPASVPVADVTINEAARVQPGWTLMNVQKGDGTATARSRTPNQAVMYDLEGQPVWYYINGTTEDRGSSVSVDLTDKGVLIGAIMNDAGVTAVSPKEIDLAGETLWECPNPTCGGSGTLTHHVGKLSNGNYVIQRDVTVGTGTAPVYEELTADNRVVWTWDWRDFVAEPPGAMGDWCHGNSITINIEKNEVYANCRWMGLVKTTYQNPTFQWHLPASYGASGMGNMTFSPPSSQYTDTHDPEIHDDGTILFYDNGGYSGVVGEEGNPHGYHSRAVEYEIDEAAKTATLVWEFPGNFDVDPWYKNDWYIPFWGDADRLANGNVLVTAGVRGPNSQSRIFEVAKQDGQVVWEFRLPKDHGVYRSERITPPLVHAIQP